MRNTVLILIALLGSPNFKTREAAQDCLVVLNNVFDYRQEVRRAVLSRDREVSRRAALVLDSYASDLKPVAFASPLLRCVDHSHNKKLYSQLWVQAFGDSDETYYVQDCGVADNSRNFSEIFMRESINGGMNRWVARYYIYKAKFREWTEKWGKPDPSKTEYVAFWSKTYGAVRQIFSFAR